MFGSGQMLVDPEAHHIRDRRSKRDDHEGTDDQRHERTDVETMRPHRWKLITTSHPETHDQDTTPGRRRHSTISLPRIIPIWHANSNSPGSARNSTATVFPSGSEAGEQRAWQARR